MPKRKYRNTVQAEIATRTRERIMQAALALFAEHWIDDVTLDQVAERAGVTVQTVLRHFGSKEGLGAEVGRAANDVAISQRAEVVDGDIPGAVDNLVQHYEEVGDRVIRLLAQEERYPQLQELLLEGRLEHRHWVNRVFGSLAKQLTPEQRERLMTQLIVVCDVYVWKLYRRDMSLSVDQYRATLLDMILALTNPFKE